MVKLVSLRPTIARVGSVVFGRNLLARAAEIVELAPEVERETLPALILPGELDRVRRSVRSSTVDKEREALTAKSRRHGATFLYRFEDTLLGNRTVYAAGTYSVRGVRPSRFVLAGECCYVKEAQLCTHSVIDRYFGHWLREAMPMELLAAERGLPGLSFKRQTWLHEPGYRALMNLPGEPISLARVDTLWIPDLRGLNDHFVRCFKELRDRVRTAGDGQGARMVYLDRGSTGVGRQIANSDELRTALARWGFEIVMPEQLSAPEIVQRLADARVLICVEGSAQTHATFALPPGATLISLQPEQHFNVVAKAYTDIVGIRFGVLVGEGDLERFTVDVGRLRKLLDLIE